MDEWRLRPAGRTDLPELADIYLRAREAALPAMPPGVHPADEVRTWVSGWDLDAWVVWLAELPDGRPVGYAVVGGGLAPLPVRRPGRRRRWHRDGAPGRGQAAAS